MSEEHGPKAGCNYQRCGTDDPHECPFTADAQQPRRISRRDPLHRDTQCRLRPAGSGDSGLGSHRHTIPVEWKTREEQSELAIWTVREVTQLRCQCGDEIER